MNIELNTADQQLVDLANSAAAPKRGRKRKDAGTSDAPKKEGNVAPTGDNVEKKTKKVEKTDGDDVEKKDKDTVAVGSGDDAEKKPKKTKKTKKTDEDDVEKKPKKSKKTTGDDAKDKDKANDTVAVDSGDAEKKTKKTKKTKKEKDTVAVDSGDDAEKKVKKPRKKRAKKEDDGTPKKPRKLCSYMLFVKSVRAKVVADNPTLKVTEVGKKLGEMWNALSDADKQAFKQADDVGCGVVAAADVSSGNVNGNAGVASGVVSE